MDILEIAGKHAGVIHTDDMERNNCFDYWEFNKDELEAFTKEIAEQAIVGFKSRCELVDKNYVVYSPSTQNWKLKPLYALPKD